MELSITILLEKNFYFNNRHRKLGLTSSARVVRTFCIYIQTADLRRFQMPGRQKQAAIWSAGTISLSSKILPVALKAGASFAIAIKG